MFSQGWNEDGDGNMSGEGQSHLDHGDLNNSARGRPIFPVLGIEEQIWFVDVNVAQLVTSWIPCSCSCFSFSFFISIFLHSIASFLTRSIWVRRCLSFSPIYPLLPLNWVRQGHRDTSRLTRRVCLFFCLSIFSFYLSSLPRDLWKWWRNQKDTEMDWSGEGRRRWRPSVSMKPPRSWLLCDCRDRHVLLSAACLHASAVHFARKLWTKKERRLPCGTKRTKPSTCQQSFISASLSWLFDTDLSFLLRCVDASSIDFWVQVLEFLQFLRHRWSLKVIRTRTTASTSFSHPNLFRVYIPSLRLSFISCTHFVFSPTLEDTQQPI